MRHALVVGALGASLLVGCAKNVCDRSDSFDLATKAGTCGTLVANKVLGSKDTCSAALKDCSDAEQKTLGEMMTCYEELPACASESIAVWTARELGCRSKALQVSSACRRSFFAAGELEPDAGVDAGFDAGVDAGRQPDTDGGGAVNLIVLADETDFAMAWSTRQPGTPNVWELNVKSEDGGELPAQYLMPGSLRTYALRDAGTNLTRSFFLVGLDLDAGIFYGLVDAGTVSPGVDSGTPDAGGCVEPTDCPKDRVCTVGVCKAVACTGPGTCPSGYDCTVATPRICMRNFEKDAGTPDAGVDAGPGEQPLPFLSPLVTLTTAAPVWSANDVVVSPFAGKEPDVAAIDSARQVVAVEQDNQLFAFVTDTRGGKGFVPRRIDSVGSHVKLAYQSSNDTLFACYDTFTDLGPGVRIRRSRDQGRTWGSPTEVADIVNPLLTDGGMTDVVKTCDIAPWNNGRMLVATTEGNNVTLRTVTDNLILGSPEVAFVGQHPTLQGDGGLPPGAEGSVYEPRHLALATLPADFAIHIVFAGTRLFRSAEGQPYLADTDVWGVYRDQTSGGVFSQASRLSDNGVTAGSALPQDFPTVIVDPKTKRALAAFVSGESVERANGAGNIDRDNVYIALFSPTARRWATGGDLGLFAQNALKTEYLVMTERNGEPTNLRRDWDAFAPSLSVTPTGKIFLNFLAGPRDLTSGVPESFAYVVGFDFEKASPITAGAKGWFLPPAVRISPKSAWYEALSNNIQKQGMLAACVDGQLSVYGVFIEGAGNRFGVPARPIFKSRP